MEWTQWGQWREFCRCSEPEESSLSSQAGALQNLLLKDHTHTFINTGGDVRELDFRFNVGDATIGAPFHGAHTPTCRLQHITLRFRRDRRGFSNWAYGHTHQRRHWRARSW